MKRFNLVLMMLVTFAVIAMGADADIGAMVTAEVDKLKVVMGAIITGGLALLFGTMGFLYIKKNGKKIV